MASNEENVTFEKYSSNNHTEWWKQEAGEQVREKKRMENILVTKGKRIQVQRSEEG